MFYKLVNYNKINMKKGLFLGLMLVVSTMGMAQTPAVQKIIKEGTENNQVMHHLDILTNRFGGRLLGSDAYENVQVWMQREFKKWGVNSWTENCGEMPFGFNRGPWSGHVIGGDVNFTELNFVTPSFTSGTHGIQRGKVLMEPQNEDQLKKMKNALKGAWVLVGGSSTGFPIGHSKAIDEQRAAVKKANAEIDARNQAKRAEARAKGIRNVELEPYQEFGGLYYDEMVAAGVLGFIQAAPVPLKCLYDRPLINEKIVTDFDDLPTVPDIKLDEGQYKEIKRMVQQYKDFELEFDIRNYWKVGPIPYSNVIAEIKGTEFPDEYVIVSGHLDAYDAGTGAVDCGVGIGTLMEVARLLSMTGEKPKRTIRFMAFAGEEFGIWGADAYCRQHPDEMDKISNVFHRDMGIEPPTSLRVHKEMYDDFVKICKDVPVSEEYPFTVEQIAPQPKRTALGGSDNSAFGMRGVPIYEFSCSDCRGINFNYGSTMHTNRDTYDKHDKGYAERSALVTAIVAWNTANLDHMLNRKGMYPTK